METLLMDPPEVLINGSLLIDLKILLNGSPSYGPP